MYTYCRFVCPFDYPARLSIMMQGYVTRRPFAARRASNGLVGPYPSQAMPNYTYRRRPPGVLGVFNLPDLLNFCCGHLLSQLWQCAPDDIPIISNANDRLGHCCLTFVKGHFVPPARKPSPASSYCRCHVIAALYGRILLCWLCHQQICSSTSRGASPLLCSRIKRRAQWASDWRWRRWTVGSWHHMYVHSMYLNG